MDASIKEGFMGQRMVAFGKQATLELKSKPLIAPLYFTAIGFFPNAHHHGRYRKNGSKQYILIYCQKGEGVICIDNTEVVMYSHMYYIIPPLVAHHYYAKEKNPWSIYWVHFTGTQAPLFYEKYVQQCPHGMVLKASGNHSAQLFEWMISAVEKASNAQHLEYANLSLWQLLNTFINDSFFSNAEKTSNENSLIASVIDHMKKNLDATTYIEDFAQRFSYSPSHFFALFKRHTGYSPMAYFNYLKVQKACQYLCFTTMSVKEISFSLGFDDPLYFSRLFKKNMNSSPLQYRKEYRR